MRSALLPHSLMKKIKDEGEKFLSAEPLSKAKGTNKDVQDS